MATNEQIDFVLSSFKETQPEELFKQIDKANVGIGSVLRILTEAGENPVTAGDISEKMGVSTARVAILIKKMVAKDLITKEVSKQDARITIVKLTENGRKTSNKMIDTVFNAISNIIDSVGMDKINIFISLLGEIRKVMIKNIQNQSFIEE